LYLLISNKVGLWGTPPQEKVSKKSRMVLVMEGVGYWDWAMEVVERMI
jgi:hypothetical protein